MISRPQERNLLWADVIIKDKDGLLIFLCHWFVGLPFHHFFGAAGVETGSYAAQADLECQILLLPLRKN